VHQVGDKNKSIIYVYKLGSKGRQGQEVNSLPAASGTFVPNAYVDCFLHSIYIELIPLMWERLTLWFFL
jgi:hypothetical protein